MTHAIDALETDRTERLHGSETGSMLLGAVLVGIGLKRRSIVGTVLAAVGGWILYGGIRRRYAGAATPSNTRAGALVVERSVTIDRPADELSDSLTDIDTVSRVLGPATGVTEHRPGQWSWAIPTPLGRTAIWETEITEDEPGEEVRWESLEDELIHADGTVQLRQAPADRGTEVTLRLALSPPGGALGAAVAKRASAVPERFVNTALHRFKSLVETGEIPTLEANPSARGSGDLV
ncbi:SRPBCC family protein [Halostagnicola kamekurae]|uniref:Uncharacterized membrane protein n=1 Tax=Halostagnicola kamekurae TaxID=619731 RepID=A0A1I6UCH1_9EURY|nr:SRPBCC family protein [Halostagnicola kamekurae]SFS99007.1 Uncharacterized membrane protein [Halostagnicola kamekurae]